MNTYRPDGVVRALTMLVSVAYFVVLIGMVAVLVLPPALKLIASGHPEWTWGLKVPATAPDLRGTVVTSWGTGELVVDDVPAILQVPIVMLPWWLTAVLWAHAAIVFGLLLLCLHHLRRIFQRVRDGAPFDAQNALRMRWLGLLILAIAIFGGLAEFLTALFVKSRLTSSSIEISEGLHIDVGVVFIALALIALAEIFRRGTELETEQSLVI